MKRLFFAAVFAITAFTASAFVPAGKVQVSYKVSQAFEQEFGQQKDVVWTDAANNMLRADFKMDEETITAFFNEEGKYIATTRDMKPESLPLKLRLAVNEKTAGYTLNTVFEMISAEDHSFYIEATNGEYKKVFRGFSDGSISLYSKTKLK